MFSACIRKFLNQITLTFFIGTILYAIIEAPSLGWTSSEMILIRGLGIILTYMFVKWERKAEYPMLPIGFFKFNGFSLGLIAIMLASFVMFSFMFTQMLHFQLVRGHTALEAAVRFLPLPLGLMPAAANSDRLSAKFGSNNVISMRLVLMTAASLLILHLVLIRSSNMGEF